jgi:prepilin-type N-terminal cleavage/methylation domain-containing protein
MRIRRGFSLLEMMTAIAIILVLMAIAVIAFRAVSHKGDTDSTRTTFANLRAMTAELTSTSGMSLLEGPGNTNVFEPGNTLQSPGVVLEGDGDQARYGPQVAKAQRAIGVLMRVPKNKAAIVNVTPKRLLGKVHKDKYLPWPSPKVAITPDPDGVLLTPDPPVLLDGWRNPILFVPSAGLVGVEMPDKDPLVPITAPDGRPFWASAGPDGDFTAGEDNLYSFSG